MGLSHFINGTTEPFPPTVRKLVAWHVRYAAARHGADDSTAAAALALLLDGLPDADFLAARAKLRDLIREVFRESGAVPPGWLDSIVP